MAKKMAIYSNGPLDRALVNTPANALAIGRALVDVGHLLADPTRAEIVPRKYFNRTDTRDTVIQVIVAGANGKGFSLTLQIEEPAREDVIIETKTSDLGLEV